MSSDNVIKICVIGSGATATITDSTRHYFGGYYHVRIYVHAPIPLCEEAFSDHAEYLDAVSRLGAEAEFSRTLEKMAVPEAEIDTVREQLLASFDANVLPYLQRNDFAPNFVRSEYRKKLKSSPRFQR